MTPEDIKQYITPLQESVQALYDAMLHHTKRINMLERVFKRIMELDLRVDTLEFNSNLPVKPGISEKLLDLQLRLENLESFLHTKELQDV